MPIRNTFRHAISFITVLVAAFVLLNVGNIVLAAPCDAGGLFGVDNCHGFFTNDNAPMGADAFSKDHSLPWLKGGHENDFEPSACANSETRAPGLSHPECMDKLINGIFRTDLNKTLQWCDPAYWRTDPDDPAGNPNKDTCAYNANIVTDAYLVATMLGKEQDDFDSGAVVDCSAPGHPNTMPRETCRGIAFARANLGTLQAILTDYDNLGLIDWHFNDSDPDPPFEDTAIFNHATDEGSYYNTEVLTNYHFRVHRPGDQKVIYNLNLFCGTVTLDSNGIPPIDDDGFTVTPIAERPTLTPDFEAPTTATMRGQVHVDHGRVNNVRVDRRLFIQRVGGGTTAVPGGTNTVFHNFPSGNSTWTVSPVIGTANNLNGLNLAVGDKVCMGIKVTPKSGTANSSGNVLTSTGTSPEAIDCETIVARPYIRTYGYDSFIGFSNGSRGSNCPGWQDAPYKNPVGDVSAQVVSGFNKTSGGGKKDLGAGSQLGVLSLGPVSNFSSAVLRSANPQATKGLTFANFGVANDGGSLSNGYVHCAADYYSVSKAGMTVYHGGDLNLGDPVMFPANSGIHRINKDDGGELRIHGTVSVGVQIIIYEIGNVLVTGNINYAPGPFASTKQMPSFIINNHGNMFISSNVTNMDGSYIIQPHAMPNSGRIYTCVDAATRTRFQDDATGRAGLVSQCGAQLTVHGQFISQALVANRTYSSLRYSRAGERPRGTLADLHLCGPGFAFLNLICGSEVFDVTPDLYIGPTALPAISGSGVGAYDYIVSLPPVL